MIGTLRSRLGGMGSRQGDGSSSPAELVHDANAAKANTANFDGGCRRLHTHCGLFPALVDAQVGQNTARRAPRPRPRARGYFLRAFFFVAINDNSVIPGWLLLASHDGAIPEAWTSVAHYK